MQRRLKPVLIATCLLLALSQVCVADTTGVRWVVQAPERGVYVGVYGGRSNEGSCEGVSRAVGRTMQLCDTYSSIYTLPTTLQNNESIAIAQRGTIPVTTLGCRGNGSPFNRPETTFSDIAAGKTDEYLRQDAAALKTYAARFSNNPWIMIRLFHEFNANIGNSRGNPNHNNCYSESSNVAASQSEFIAAWRHVVAYFSSQGVTNVTWVWCPATGPQVWKRHGGDELLQGFYPGDAYVDWTCADAYDAATLAGGGIQNAYAHLDFFKRIQKPLMIGETGECHTASDSPKCRQYTQTQAQFISDVQKELQPGGLLYNAGVKAWIYFDSRPLASGYDWSLDSGGLNALKAIVSNPYFYPSMPHPKPAANTTPR